MVPVPHRDPDSRLGILLRPPGAAVVVCPQHLAEGREVLISISRGMNTYEGPAVVDPFDEPLLVDVRRIDGREEDDGLAAGQVLPVDLSSVLGDGHLENALGNLDEVALSHR